MNTIIAILRAAHCKSTHHYFAIDALQTVVSPPGMQLVGMLLAHYGDYLYGAKAPDNVFKDFENHVLHVREGFWGGAATTAEKWLDKSHGWLAAGNWKEAAYSIGVLSHYFTDPFMPLHTAQSSREAVFHRPLEWSVCCSYQAIYEMASHDLHSEAFPLGSGQHWLTQSILLGATPPRESYDPLMDDYDVSESARFPKLALGREAKQHLARIFTWVLAGWGGVIEKIANETPIALPHCSLTMPTLLAGLQIPTKKIVAAFENAEQRKEVERILTEFNHTGKVIHNISPEQSRVAKVKRTQPELRVSADDVQRMVASQESHDLKDAASPQKPVIANPKSNLNAAIARADPIRISNQFVPEVVSDEATTIDKPVVVSQVPDSDVGLPVGSNGQSRKRPALTLACPIVDAPAIGPKTAARFEAIGVNTIGDLLSHDAERIAAELSAKWINARLVSQWQAQARLACRIERLSAVGSGLLVMAGIRTAEELARLSANDVLVNVLAAAKSTEGQRLLRDQAPPSLVVIQRWIDAAKATRNAA